MKVNPGDRVTVDKYWTPQQIQILGSNGHATFGLSPGDVGTAVAETTPGVWVILFDKGPTESVLVADIWLIPPAALVEATPAEIKADEPKPCTCSVNTLMAQGCICGHIKRYVPPHKREGVKNEAP
jgi:hypothetical protein